jgi:ABC-type microcin C transport system duplicated ATPase subunit YejF
MLAEQDVRKVIPRVAGTLAWQHRHLPAFSPALSSLNPRHTIGRILTEPVLLHGLAQDHAAALALVQGVLERVGLQRNTVERYSFELSGGQRLAAWQGLLDEVTLLTKPFRTDYRSHIPSCHSRFS